MTNVTMSAAESLIQRELAFTSVTADGLTETFNLDVSIFDAGVRQLKNRKTSGHSPPLTCGAREGQ